VTDRKALERVSPVLVGLVASRIGGVRVGYRDISSRDRGALLIRNRAADGSSNVLRASGQRSTENERKNYEQRENYSLFAYRFIYIQKSSLHSFTPRGNICAETKKETMKSARKGIAPDS